jgi:hypothetical protein
VNFFYQQTIVGLLRHAAQEIPAIAERSIRVSGAIDRAPGEAELAEAFTLFQEATRLSRDPVYLTGAFYVMKVMKNGAENWQETLMNPTVHKDEIAEEVERGLLELLDRIRQGATLDEALALFPLIGEELSPNL